MSMVTWLIAGVVVVLLMLPLATPAFVDLGLGERSLSSPEEDSLLQLNHPQRGLG